MSLPSIDRVRDLSTRGEYQQALVLIDRVIDSGYADGELMLLKAACIQLSDGTEHTLDDAEQCLRRAVELAPDSSEAACELGWFLLNVRDAATDALPHFEAAVKKSKADLTSIIVGAVSAKKEATSRAEAARYVETLGDSLLDTEAIIAALED
jgi:Tfp pilus assembly protein PilF